MGDLIPHPGSSGREGGALIVQDPEQIAKLREERIVEVSTCCLVAVGAHSAAQE